VSLFQRNSEALLTEGAERSSVETSNGILDALYANKSKMSEMASQQLKDLYAGDGYGRHLRLGLTADEASKLVTRAFR